MTIDQKKEIIQQIIQDAVARRELSVKTIKTRIKMALNEEAGVLFDWTAHTAINEISGQSEGRVHNIAKIKVVTFDPSTELPVKLEYYL